MNKTKTFHTFWQFNKHFYRIFLRQLEIIIIFIFNTILAICESWKEKNDITKPNRCVWENNDDDDDDDYEDDDSERNDQRRRAKRPTRRTRREFINRELTHTISNTQMTKTEEQIKKNTYGNMYVFFLPLRFLFIYWLQFFFSFLCSSHNPFQGCVRITSRTIKCQVEMSNYANFTNFSVFDINFDLFNG